MPARGGTGRVSRMILASSARRAARPPARAVPPPPAVLPASGGEGPGPEAARRVHEQARRLREEARRARDEAIGAGRLGDPVGAGFRPGDHDWDPPGGSGWGQGPGWTDWPGRRGWEDWARMRGRPGWPGGLDFGTLRDLERVAVQFTSDLRRVAMQSSAAGENVITDLRTILEDALDRIKSEIFGPGSGPGHEEAEGKGPGTAGAAGSSRRSATTFPLTLRSPTLRSPTTLPLRATPGSRPGRTDPLEGEDDLAEQVAGDHGLETVARLGQRQHPVDDRAGPGLLEEPGQPAELIA